MRGVLESVWKSGAEPHDDPRAVRAYRWIRWVLFTCSLLAIPAFYAELTAYSPALLRAGQLLYLCMSAGYASSLAWMLHLSRKPKQLLLREWNKAHPTLSFLMLNPSTADHHVNDPTIERCLARAANDGFGRLEVVNLYPLRATDPDELLKHHDPLGCAETADRSIMDCIEH